jgi:hypothetical protein
MSLVDFTWKQEFQRIPANRIGKIQTSPVTAWQTKFFFNFFLISCKKKNHFFFKYNQTFVHKMLLFCYNWNKNVDFFFKETTKKIKIMIAEKKSEESFKYWI